MTGESTDVAIVGGGIFGCSIAWHLKRSRPDVRVTVLERAGALATQATSQAAALLTRARHPAAMPLVARTYAAIDELGRELGERLPLRTVGTLHVAASAASLAALTGTIETCRATGLRCERPDARALGKLVPWLDGASVRGSAFMPEDGFVDPWLLADAYARAARAWDVEIRLGVEARSVLAPDGRVEGVSTSAGPLPAPVVVLAAGAWANRLAAPLGCGLAMVPVRSQYWLTGPDPIFPKDHPAVVLPDASAYTRPELGALLFGLRERATLGLDARTLPDDMTGFAFDDDPDGWRALEAGAPALRRFLPALERLPLRRHVAGVSTYTPDGLFLLGPVPGVDGLLVAGGCCGAGVAASGGMGEALAALILGGPPPFEVEPFRPDRFGTVDPFMPAFRERCALARARKTSG